MMDCVMNAVKSTKTDGDRINGCNSDNTGRSGSCEQVLQELSDKPLLLSQITLTRSSIENTLLILLNMFLLVTTLHNARSNETVKQGSKYRIGNQQYKSQFFISPPGGTRITRHLNAIDPDRDRTRNLGLRRSSIYRLRHPARQKSYSAYATLRQDFDWRNVIFSNEVIVSNSNDSTAPVYCMNGHDTMNAS
ncbi:hypothetical protein ANN_24118 [Periplaneta americana]|uniref:Uncharacterized protein n=1 Tax=Periplaneta americana TaxID=6978 RepID=A0ABQ8S2I2_PERAM|nr:hypothetical protein ANN_24118 [Periplaneta americana]